LRTVLTGFGYEIEEAIFISDCVAELTNVFTKRNYPDLDKKTRKRKEADRLAAISPAAQTIKYADLMCNADWMLKYDPEQAQKYLKKKKMLLVNMKDGDRVLQSQAIKKLAAGLAQFE